MPHSTVELSATIEGQRVDIYPLETIDYARLTSRDDTEIAKLLKACQNPGFFHLNLENEPTGRFLPDLRKVYELSKEYFDRPQDETSNGSSVANQKPEHKQGSLEVAHAKLIKGDFAFPSPLDDHGGLLVRFIWLCQSINKTMLSCLSDSCRMEGNERFEDVNRDDKPGETAFNLIHAPTKSKRADCPDTTHTDGGTLTLLCCDDWGIMLEDPETKRWAFCEPKPGCALINVGDALQRLSGNKLHSCRHAVTQPVDGFRRRFYVVSYLRPETSP